MIRVLSKSVADKIAAGEVVDRPLSIVKELLENAIDSRADNISVEIKNGGKSYIRVSDNGCGIPQEQLSLAFQRHATSKIATEEDLNSIHTLGFRGEALSSIAAVSRVELITKVANEQVGSFIKINGGDELDLGARGCPEGTTIVVTDLFYNTPARLKFLKTDATESTIIIDLVSKIALAYPKIKIRLVNNGNILFSTSGKGDIYKNILTVYSKSAEGSLIYIEKHDDFEGLHIVGHISPPAHSKTNRTRQIFFVNGRVISSKVLDIAVSSSYKDRLFDGRFPVAYLFLTVDSKKLDVNIHPNKKEVRFYNDKIIIEFVGKAIVEGLNKKAAITQIPQKLTSKDIFKLDAAKGNIEDEKSQEKSSQKTEKVDIKKLLSTYRNFQEDESKILIKEEVVSYENRSKFIRPLDANNPSKQVSFEEIKIDNIAEVKASLEIDAEKPMPVSQTHSFIKNLKLTGFLFGTYITAVDENTFYIVDQHAAHERIFYEKFLKSYKTGEKFSQQLLTPIVINLDFARKNAGQCQLEFLQKSGYEIEDFGAKSYIIKAVPMFMDFDEAKEFAEYFFENASENFMPENEKAIEKLITKACKSSIKAHDYINMSEAEALMKDLALCENPHSCPHGRPVFIKITQNEIERMFKRV